MISLDLLTPRKSEGIIRDFAQVGGFAIETAAITELASKALKFGAAAVLRPTLFVVEKAVDMYFGDFPNLATGTFEED